MADSEVISSRIEWLRYISIIQALKGQHLSGMGAAHLKTATISFYQPCKGVITNLFGINTGFMSPFQGLIIRLASYIHRAATLCCGIPPFQGYKNIRTWNKNDVDLTFQW